MNKASQIFEDKIRQEAFEIYEYRIENGIEGDALSDWLTAEAKLLYAKCSYTREDEG